MRRPEVQEQEPVQNNFAVLQRPAVLAPEPGRNSFAVLQKPAVLEPVPAPERAGLQKAEKGQVPEQGPGPGLKPVDD